MDWPVSKVREVCKRRADYLLTWNCKHLAHGEVRKKLKRYNDAVGLDTPEIVTPDELMRRDE